MAFTESQEEILVICSFGFSLSSLLSSMTVIVYYLTFEELRKFSFTLVAWTALADFIRCVGNLMGNPEEETLCEAQGFLKTLGGVASLSWVGCMAFAIHLIYSRKIINTGSLFWKFQIITWTVSTMSALLPFIYNLYEPVGGWCWISKHEEGVILRWTSFYVIVWLDIMWICFVYLPLWLSLKDVSLEERLEKIVSRLKFYPLILIVCYGPASVRRIWDFFGNPPYWLAVLHICLSSLHGLANALAYGWNADVRALNAKIIDNIFGDCKGLREVTRQNSGVSWAVWQQKHEFTDTEEMTTSAQFSLAPPPPKRGRGISEVTTSTGRGISEVTTSTLHSSNLESQTVTIQIYQTQYGKGEIKPKHNKKSKENIVGDARKLGRI